MNQVKWIKFLVVMMALCAFKPAEVSAKCNSGKPKNIPSENREYFRVGIPWVICCPFCGTPMNAPVLCACMQEKYDEYKRENGIETK